MASSLLRATLSRFILRRPVHLYGYWPAEKGPDPSINMDFHESLTSPLPARPRVIEYEGALKTLKEKEKGDWKNLSHEERMDLYNMYFGMTVSDMLRGNDEWKSSFGFTMVLVSVSILISWAMKEYCSTPNAPSSVDPDWVAAAIKRELQFHAGPITGYASMWDYENNCWKK